MIEFPEPKKPKIEITEDDVEEVKEEDPEEAEKRRRREQEEALVALVEHRTKEVEHLRQRITYYTSQLEEAEKRLEDTQGKLARLQGEDIMRTKKLRNGNEEVKIERRSASPITVREDPSTSQPQLKAPHQVHSATKSSGDDPRTARRPPSPLCKNGTSSKSQTQSKPPLLIPSVAPKMQQPLWAKEPGNSESGNKFSGGSSSLPPGPALTFTNSIAKLKGNKARMVSSEEEGTCSQPKGAKRKLEQRDKREHRDLIPLIKGRSSPNTIRCQTGCLLSSQHKRKLRSLVLCPTNDQLFVTSALDGVVNLWQVQGRGSGANLLSTTDCQSEKQRRWAEDVAWHPMGNKLFSVYHADGGDSQVSILNLNQGKERTRVSYLADKPHIKGIINSILFMPWDGPPTFVTGGSDHAVHIWSEKEREDLWKPKLLHKHLHSSAVMGVAGLQHKKIVMSAGADKRIIGFDVETGRADYKHQIESKCMSVLPNPCDFNLFMVQTGTPERQLKLYDIRLRQTEIHAFGWKQESSESQSALINQAWSPDGYYVTSGSADPIIHIFDIRFNAHRPSQSISAHQKRVFKAVWHHALPLLISISSDLNIGLHKIL